MKKAITFFIISPPLVSVMVGVSLILIKPVHDYDLWASGFMVAYGLTKFADNCIEYAKGKKQ